MPEPIVTYPCCRHCEHDPGFVHQGPCHALIFEGKECDDE